MLCAWSTSIHGWEDAKLLSKDLDAIVPWLDPQDTIDETRVAVAAENLGVSVPEARRRYEALADRFQLHLSWHGGSGKSAG
jgi:hypothetical protein